MSKYNIAHELGSKPKTKDVLLPEGEDIDFTSMLLPQPILQGLHSSGFVKPSPIQSKAIPLARCGFDLIVQAKSGTGKTCVFAVAALEHVVLESKRLQAIIFAPTREIAQQIEHVVSHIGCCLKSLKVSTFIGGVPIQKDKVNAVNCQIAVGAPGRLRHLIEEKYLLPDAVRFVVLDEADKLMEEAFQEDINFIFKKLPESKQVIACSATYTQDLLNFLGNYMQSATHVTPGQDPSPLLIGLRHLVCIEPASRNTISKLTNKDACLLKILKNVSFLQCLVFSNYQSRAESICNGLRRDGWKALWIAGKQDQTVRTSVITKVKDLKVRILVTTDLTARGIDLHEVNLVINMDVPRDHHTYLHRMGRAGRYGGHGLVITILTEDEVNKFRRLLGSIGGSYASAYVIPDSKPSDDLWTCDATKLEQIVGVNYDNDYSDDKSSDSDVKEDEEQNMNVNKNSSDLHVEGIVVEKDIKVEVENVHDNAMNENNSRSNDSSYCCTGSSKIKEESDADVNTEDTENGCYEKVNILKKDLLLKLNGNEIVKNEAVNDEDDCNYDESDEDNEEVNSDSDSDSEDLINTVKSDQTDEDIETNSEFYDELIKFGEKLLHYFGNEINVQSYSDLEESLNNFIEDKKDMDNTVLFKKLVEPTGTIDIEYIENFSKKLKCDYRKLISVCTDLDSVKALNWLANDTTGACLNDVLELLKRVDDRNIGNPIENSSKMKDPEYYSPSSSDDDNDCKNDDNRCSDDDDDVEFNNTNKIGNSDIKKRVDVDCNEIRKNFNNINVSSAENKRSVYNFEPVENKTIVSIPKLPVSGECEKTVLFLRKSNSPRKRKPTTNISSPSSQSSNECKFTDKNLSKVKSSVSSKNKKVKKIKQVETDNGRGIDNENCGNTSKVKTCVKSLSKQKNQSITKTIKPNFFDVSDHKLYKDVETTSTRVNERSNVNNENMDVCFNNYNHSGRSSRDQLFSYENHNQFGHQQRYSVPMNNMPKEVQNWYNLWYRHNANLQWYVGYNEYIKNMLNPRK